MPFSSHYDLYIAAVGIVIAHQIHSEFFEPEMLDNDHFF